jgi:hypothetical protein
VTRPVIGAHTSGYNQYSFAMSAIGNFETVRPTSAMLQAYGRLMGWKLSLHGVNAADTSQRLGNRYFRAINGHRDAGSTACPGRYLYAKIPQIRRLAAEAQRGWSGRELESDLAGSTYPDLVVRRASDGQGFIIPTGGLTAFGAGVSAATGLTADQTPVVTPDVTGDGVGDLVVQDAGGSAEVRPGDGNGAFGAAVRTTKQLAGHDLITAVGDLNGDDRNDLVARAADTGRLDAYLGRGDGRFRVKRLGPRWDRYTALIGAGDQNGDGKADLLARAKDGTVWLHRGGGRGGFGGRQQVPGG